MTFDNSHQGWIAPENLMYFNRSSCVGYFVLGLSGAFLLSKKGNQTTAQDSCKKQP